MQAASERAMKAAAENLAVVLGGENASVSTAAKTGSEIFDVVELLDGNRALRVAVADSSTPGQSRKDLVDNLFGSKVSKETLDVLLDAAGRDWSNPREMRQGLVTLGRFALLYAAERDGQLERVEDELFRLSRILDSEPKLTQLLSDKTATGNQKRELLANVLYGKVASVTEALALQAVARPEDGPIDDFAALSALAASMRGRDVARVTTAAELTDGQRQELAAQLKRIYGRDMSLHEEVDSSLLGGLIVRVGHEIIDGSTAGKLERLRAKMA